MNVNLIPLWEWTWRHNASLHAHQSFNRAFFVVVWIFFHKLMTAPMLYSCLTENMQWHHIHSQSGIKLLGQIFKNITLQQWAKMLFKKKKKKKKLHVKLSSLNAQLSFPTNPSHKWKELRFLLLNAQLSFPVILPHKGKKSSLHLEMHSYPSPQILPHMGKDLSFLPPKPKTIRGYNTFLGLFWANLPQIAPCSVFFHRLIFTHKGFFVKSQG